MIKNIKKTSSLGLLDFPPSRISVFQACDPRMNTMAFRKYIFCMVNLASPIPASQTTPGTVIFRRNLPNMEQEFS